MLESALPGVFSVGGDLRAISVAGPEIARLVHALARDAHALVATLARIDGPTEAFGFAKRMVRDAAHTSLEERLEQEARVIARTAAAPAGRAGVVRFLS